MKQEWRDQRPDRQEGLEIEEAADGFLVYQPQAGRVHYLNHTAALVLEMCDGSRTGAEIAAVLARLYSLEEAPQEGVEEALAKLDQEGLISWGDAGSAAQV